MVVIKKIIILLIIFIIASLSTVSAGNNTTIIDYPTVHIEDTETVVALESGDSNISFSDGYKGYCIEWGEHSAEAGNDFYVHNDVDNNIKTFFVYFYKESQRDVIATQHMIWKFTDNKQFSRFNQTLYDQIIAKAKTVQVPNDGTLKINNTTEMVFSFKNFVSPIEEYQNYFGYKIFFRNITDDLLENSTDNLTLSITQMQNFTSNILFDGVYTIKDVENSHTSTSHHKKIAIDSSHTTGIKINYLITCVITLLSICLIIRFFPKH